MNALREVVVRISLEVNAGQGLSRLDALLKEVGAKAGRSYTDGLQTALSRGFGENGPGRRTFGLGSGSMYMPGASEIRHGLDAMEKEDILLRRLTHGQREYAKSVEFSADKLGKLAESSLEMIRGLSLLGAGTSENMKPYLQIAAQAQGLIDTAASGRKLLGDFGEAWNGSGLGETAGGALAQRFGGSLWNGAKWLGGKAVGALTSTPAAVAALGAGALQAAPYARDLLAGRNTRYEDTLFGQLGLPGYDLLGDAGALKRHELAMLQHYRDVAGPNARNAAHWSAGTSRRIGFGLNRFLNDDLFEGSEDDRLSAFRGRAGRSLAYLDSDAVRSNAMFNDSEGVGQARLGSLRARVEQQFAEVEEGLLRKSRGGLLSERDRLLGGVQSATQNLLGARESYGSMQAGFGRLDAGSQMWARNLAKRLEEGGTFASPLEAIHAERFGLGGQATRNYLEKQGEQAGFGDVARGFGLDSGVKDAQQRLRDAMRDRDSAMPDIVKELEQNTEERKAIARKIEAAFNKSIEADTELLGRMQRVEQKLDAFEHRYQRDGIKRNAAGLP